MYGVRYLRVFDYVSVSECATGPVRESEVCPERPQMIKITNAPITPIRLLSDDSSNLVVMNTAEILVSEKKSTLEEGGGLVRKDQFPLKNTINKKKIQKPTGEFESVNTRSSDSGRDIDELKGAGGVVKAGQGRFNFSLSGP